MITLILKTSPSYFKNLLSHFHFQQQYRRLLCSGISSSFSPYFPNDNRSILSSTYCLFTLYEVCLKFLIKSFVLLFSHKYSLYILDTNKIHSQCKHFLPVCGLFFVFCFFVFFIFWKVSFKEQISRLLPTLLLEDAGQGQRLSLLLVPNIILGRYWSIVCFCQNANGCQFLVQPRRYHPIGESVSMSMLPTSTLGTRQEWSGKPTFCWIHVG